MVEKKAAVILQSLVKQMGNNPAGVVMSTLQYNPMLDIRALFDFTFPFSSVFLF